ncbi:class I SAM-dependent DNA methyltransferase [Streptomyces sp. NPDC058773]|uniref:class I SAM-dependent DNA methyltransferase n=1 Tax=Streptomyces sp. NPDC058773 TaxID=3346632 RepID=UPI00367D660E
MFTEHHADVFESIYRSRGKDWRQEAKDISGQILARVPRAGSLLDVACGTGAHLTHFREDFADTAGVELAEPMLELARKRLTGTPLHHGDMRAFDLGRAFDAVVCMFCSIGYLDNASEMRDAIAAMARHVNPGGVLVIEPWWFPEQFIDGYVAGDLSREKDRTITRVSHSIRQGDKSRMELRYVVGEPSGITEFTEIELLSLWPKDAYLAAFEDAGCPAEYLEGGPTGRGLFIGTRQS